MTRKAARLALVIALVVLGTVQTSGATHRWVNYHWARSRNPVTLGFQTQVSGTWGALVGGVMYRWNNVHKQRPGTPDIVNWTGGSDVSIQSGNYGANGWFGLATLQVNILTGHISGAVVKVNDYYFKGQYNNDTARRHVLCQEVGHTLGLEHNHVALAFGASCMNDDNATLNKPEYRFPNHHDTATLNGIYKHRDGGAAIKAANDQLRWVTVHITPAL